MKKDEAEKELLKHPSRYDDWEGFCPVYAGPCRRDCLSFHQAKVVKNGTIESSWSIKPALCSNPNVTGFITVEQ